MESVIDKDRRLSEGQVVAEDGKLDFEELSDDEEVTIHLPRKGADECDLPGEGIRDLPGAPVTQREDWFNVEPLHGARPKWNQVGRHTLENEKTRGLEAEAPGGLDGLDAEERGAPTPQLPPPRRDVQDFGADRRNVPWSSENVLIDTVARLQQDLAAIRAESRQFRTPGVPHVVPTPRQAAFTTTKVPRFTGKTSWDQYRQVAIVRSNGWDDSTAALQLLSHLEGDALNVALLVPAPRQTSRLGLVDALSEHYG